MTDNFGFQEGNDRNARARELSEGLVVPMTEAASSIPTVLGCVNQSVTTTAAALSEIPEGATHALVAVDADVAIRFRDDGENPTTSSGLYVAGGGAVEFTNLADVRVIAVEATAKINISYRTYGE